MNFIKQKKFILFCIIFLTFIFIGWVVVKSRVVQDQLIPLIPIIQMSNTNGMKIYINEKYGFKLEYPEKYIIKEVELFRSSEEGIPEEQLEGYKYEKPVSSLFYLEFYSSSTRKYPEIKIAIYNANKLNIKEWINYINRGVKEGLIYEGRYINSVEPISILGIESAKTLSGCCMECVASVLIPKENKIYDLKQNGSISSPQECLKGFNEQNGCCWQNEDEFNHILSTFKFLK